MKTRIITTAILFLLSIMLLPVQANHPNQASIKVPTAILALQFVSQAHQLLANGCYNAQVLLSVLWNGTGTRVVAIGNFWVYETGSSGLTVTNQTYYAHPVNPLGSVTVFPNIPIGLVLYFANFCLIMGVVNPQIWLFYFDGTLSLNVQIG